MSWSNRRNAVRLVDRTTGVYPLAATSVAVVRPDAAQTPLRMFGVSEEQVRAGVNDLASPFRQAPVNTMQPLNSNNLRNIGVINGSHGPSGQDFRIVPGSNIIGNTSIPAQRQLAAASTEPVVCYNYSQSGRNILIRSFYGSELTGVAYKDPCVLYLPSIGLWMMVLCRARVFANTGGPFSANPFTSISDIVAFTSTVSTFDQGIQGPYWLADSTSALSSANYRLSLGVPCAFEYVDSTGAYLYLYYSIDPCDVTHNQPQPPGTLNISSAGVYVDIGTYPGGTFVSQLGVKVISTSHFLSAPAVQEAAWEIDAANYLNNVVPGVLQTSVNLWVAVRGSLTYDVVSFDDATENARPVDPAVVVDPALSTQDPGNVRAASSSIGQDISLYFAANMIYSTQTTATTSYGVWRASAVPAGWGTQLNVFDSVGGSLGYATPTFGVDFIVRGAAFDTVKTRWAIGTDDSVAASVGATDANVDPEPVLLYSGTWRVFMGHGDVYNPNSSTPVTLQYVENSSSLDTFCSISSAWT